jgi:flavin-binding protein dodecin
MVGDITYIPTWEGWLYLATVIDWARSAVETAAATVRELRVAEVVRQDVTIENGSVTSFRVRLEISFKYDSDS